MNKKHVLAVGLFAAMFAACSQEELVTSPQTAVDLGDRPAVGSPALDFGPSTRMGVDDDFNGVKWEVGVDGMGACIIDQVADLTAENWGDKYTITPDYISTNYKYVSTAENKGTFSTTALMVEGNYMFYAPYSNKHLTRNAISVNLPIEQNVTEAMPNNAIDEFYKSGSPVYVGYQALMADRQEASLSLKMFHIFAYPEFALKNSYKEKDVATDITVTKVEFTRDNSFVVKAPIDNEKLMAAINGDSAPWVVDAIETANTAEILEDDALAAIGNKAGKITVNFGEGIVVKAGEKFSFNAVLPADSYRVAGDRIKATVYTSNNKKFETIFVAGDMALNPGKRFPADEYNTDGTLKVTKGTLATFDLKGALIDAGTAVGPTVIRNAAEFSAFLKDVATRYRDLVEVSKDFVELNTAATAEAIGNPSEAVAYDQGLHFVLANDADLILDDKVIDDLNNFIYAGGNGGAKGKVTFLASSALGKLVTIGNMTKLKEYNILFTGEMTKVSAVIGVNAKPAYVKIGNSGDPAISISGDVTLTGTGAAVPFTKITVPAKAKLTLDKDLDVAATLDITNDGGTIVWEGGKVKSIVNTKGTLNITQDCDATVTNGDATDKTKAGIINIDANVSVLGAVTNKVHGTINNSGIMYSATNVNNGLINVVIKAAVTKVASGTGKIVNNVLGAVSATTQDVIYTATSAVTGKIQYATTAGINYVVLNNGWAVENATDITAAATAGTTKPATIEFAGGSFTTPETAAFDANTELIFSANTTWTGDAAAASKPAMTGAKVTVKDGKVLTVKFITVTGAVGSTAEGEQIVEAIDGTYSVAP